MVPEKKHDVYPGRFDGGLEDDFFEQAVLSARKISISSAPFGTSVSKTVWASKPP